MTNQPVGPTVPVDLLIKAHRATFEWMMAAYPTRGKPELKLQTAHRADLWREGFLLRNQAVEREESSLATSGVAPERSAFRSLHRDYCSACQCETESHAALPLGESRRGTDWSLGHRDSGWIDALPPPNCIAFLLQKEKGKLAKVSAVNNRPWAFILRAPLASQCKHAI